MTESFGEKLKAARKAKGLTLEQMSELAGISIGHLSDLENNKKPIPMVEVITKLEIAAGVDLQEFKDRREDAIKRISLIRNELIGKKSDEFSG